MLIEVALLAALAMPPAPAADRLPTRRQLSDAVLELADEVERLKAQLAACEADVDAGEALFQQSLADQDNIIEIYEKRLTHYRRARKWDRALGWLKIGGGFAAGYLVGEE